MNRTLPEAENTSDDPISSEPEEILMDENTQKNPENLFDSNDTNVAAAGNETNYTLSTTLTADIKNRQ